MSDPITPSSIGGDFGLGDPLGIVNASDQPADAGGFRPVGNVLNSLEQYKGKKAFTIKTVGNGEIHVVNPSGQVVHRIPADKMAGMDPKELASRMGGYIGEGIEGTVGVNAEGKLFVGFGRNPPPAPSDLTNRTTGSGPKSATNTPTTTSAPPASTPSGGGGGTQGTGVPQGQPSPNLPGQMPPIGGSGPTQIDPNASLGVNDPGKQTIGLGDYFQGSRGGLGNLPSVFDNLPDNPTLKDIIGAVQRSGEATGQAQQDIFAGLFDESLNSQGSQNERGLANSIMENPESMDEATIQRIMGQNNQAIGSRASQLGQLAQDRAASQGVGRDIGQREQARILREGAQQQTEAERSTRIDAAKTNFQDRINALGAGGTASRAQRGERAQIGTHAAASLGDNRVTGDAFLTNALLSGPDTPKIAGFNTVRFNSRAPTYNY